MARVIDCPCGHVRGGATDGDLFRLARKHIDEDHPEINARTMKCGRPFQLTSGTSRRA